MDIHVIYDYCLAKMGTIEAFPFDEETLTFKVGGKMYLLLNLRKWEQGDCFVNLKCDPERAEELRGDYSEITPGYHMSKKHWNSIQLGGAVQWPLLKDLIDHSYDLVYNSLTKKVKEELEK
ncbi:MmcQ/YjbR family DNA-binding protein [Myroides pelagicus]|uniref:MmcQ/YjbR family DNA-binding protein n=1 Tax=Myroides pelagicus TaxID=270914 RepID=A0A7K1GLY7_9FLAO|nr:MmcQ/YjbR family DNA-binding protein [Myroides pelagicus]MEC4112574.1 MmcQ/YjbR family DNA-binding protein [Myroides pelagicus]MTH29549.1 MmcQ/YjbR family DNA-binding protein [Myroides pelagicus]